MAWDGRMGGIASQWIGEHVSPRVDYRAPHAPPAERTRVMIAISGVSTSQGQVQSKVFDVNGPQEGADAEGTALYCG